ncbi:MAG: hypothetical protein FJ144_02370 [Deltaproteobacteria bacterium]|nr:hypothetical protein [Deltaproteobacteria bacterium]
MVRWVLVALVALAACGSEPAFVTYQKELALLRQMDDAFERSVEAEKNAVLAVGDQEPAAFAAESKAAADEVDRDLVELRKLLKDGRPEELAKLETLSVAWNDLRAVDAHLLVLAVANTNLKAMRLSSGAATTSLDRLVATLGKIATQSSDPDQIRELATASIAALRIQVRHAPHIASADSVEMDGLEAEMRRSKTAIDRILAELQAEPEGLDRAQLETAVSAWKTYVHDSEEVVQLSRENTDVRSFDISVHEKREAVDTFRRALADLVDEIQSSMTATR